jgi:xylan 1,4-beta-xylosidase
MKKIAVLYLFICLAFRVYAQSPAKQTTICNPLNLSYRFALDTPSRREAADPAIILFKNKYYLFASKSGGYWKSDNLISWSFITSADLPLEDYAPAAVVVKDTVYFMASPGQVKQKIYKTNDPGSGKWKIANADFPIHMTDPDLFLDDDGKLYFYYGCSDKTPIYGVELDRKTLNPIGKPVECFNSDIENHGWERPGDYNELKSRPWVEGAWMTKHKGKYYLQYAMPGTQYKSYGDGVYTADSSLGPFKIAVTNPVSYKPEGFIAGAGHSGTFQDKYGNYWHVSTMTISVKHMFERRLGLFPMFFDKDGELYTYTAFGDFPHVIPQKHINGPADFRPKSMLLSYNKPVQVSSALPDHPKTNAVNEDVRTYWCAQTGNKGEWITVDLQKQSHVTAVQINFAEEATRITGRSDSAYYQYLLEYSSDNKTWRTISNKTLKTDLPHDYIELATPVSARYIRLTNKYIPDGKFAISGLRVFGKGNGQLPAVVTGLSVNRNADARNVSLSWKKGVDAVGYNVRFGTSPDKLYLTYQVLNTNGVTIHSLTRRQKYYFAVDAFNQNGIAKAIKVSGAR